MWAAIKQSLRRTLLDALGVQARADARSIDLELQRRSLATTADYVERHLSRAQALASRSELLALGLASARPTPGLICEFGVYKGETINQIAGLVAPRRVFGFDSFEGLPEDWRPGFPKARFSLLGAPPDVLENVELLKGRFDTTLPAFLARHEERFAFVHVDCDLYSSTKTVLELAASRIGAGTVIVFDEYFNFPGWEQHEFKAFQEFVRATGARYEYLAYSSRDEQVAVRML